MNMLFCALLVLQNSNTYYFLPVSFVFGYPYDDPCRVTFRVGDLGRSRALFRCLVPGPPPRALPPRQRRVPRYRCEGD